MTVSIWVLPNRFVKKSSSIAVEFKALMGNSFEKLVNFQFLSWLVLKNIKCYLSWGRSRRILFRRRSLDSSKSSEQEIMWFCNRSNIRFWISFIENAIPLPNGASRSMYKTELSWGQGQRLLHSGDFEWVGLGLEGFLTWTEHCQGLECRKFNVIQTETLGIPNEDSKFGYVIRNTCYTWRGTICLEMYK